MLALSAVQSDQTVGYIRSARTPIAVRSPPIQSANRALSNPQIELFVTRVGGALVKVQND